MESIDRSKNTGTAVASKSGESAGVLESFFDGGINMAETLVSGCVDVLEESRAQVNQRVAQTLDWAEGFPSAYFSFARKLNTGADRIAAESIRSGERIARSMLAAARRAGDGARGFVSETASSIVGNGSRRVQSTATTTMAT